MHFDNQKINRGFRYKLPCKLWQKLYFCKKKQVTRYKYAGKGSY